MNIPVPIEELNVEKIVYKFKNYNTLSVNTLLNNKIYIPSANEFNDPLDSKTPFRYDVEELTEENIYKKCLLISKQSFPSLKEEEHQQNAYDNQKKGLLFDEDHLNKCDIENYNNTCNNFGIFCTTPDINNFLMWSYYSNSHKGFAIGYNTENLIRTQIFGMGGKIIYDNQFPVLPLFPSEKDHHFISLFFTKSDVWDHESEFRFLHIYKNGKELSVPKDVIAEIVLGVNFPENEKIKFMNQINTGFPNAKVYQMELVPLKFNLEKKLIYDPQYLRFLA
ncbi:DUF2971 domain-containing protein [Pedobacter immunditicola]|uniref:DUF2971 domain-containing protein n=1 Tax=Pedobacter immunditicola TaxID=3133440 RepID=UPI0030A227B9